MIVLSLFSVGVVSLCISLYFSSLSTYQSCLNVSMNIYLVLSIYSQPMFIYWHIHLSVFVPLVIYLSFVITIYIFMFLPILLINFRLWYKGTPKYLGEGVTGMERGIQNLEDGSCIIGRKQGGDTGRCTGMSVRFDCTCAELSHPR